MRRRSFEARAPGPNRGDSTNNFMFSSINFHYIEKFEEVVSSKDAEILRAGNKGEVGEGQQGRAEG